MGYTILNYFFEGEKPSQ